MYMIGLGDSFLTPDIRTNHHRDVIVTHNRMIDTSLAMPSSVKRTDYTTLQT
jgi:hypothetical protein